jgi:hypothetical protein
VVRQFVIGGSHFRFEIPRPVTRSAHWPDRLFGWPYDLVKVSIRHPLNDVSAAVGESPVDRLSPPLLLLRVVAERPSRENERRRRLVWTTTMSLGVLGQFVE